MNLYVSNLNPTTKEVELRIFFQKAGKVSSVKIIRDRYTGHSKGFGFIDIPDDCQAGDAIQQLTNTSLADRKTRDVEGARKIQRVLRSFRSENLEIEKRID